MGRGAALPHAGETLGRIPPARPGVIRQAVRATIASESLAD